MLIVLEGLDGSGKTTQVNLLRKYCEQRNIGSYFLHFPRFDAPLYGDLIAAFLRGEFGEVNSVNPRIVALLYAGDRHAAAPLLNDHIAGNSVVILDRYVYSNIAFQCAKLSDSAERNSLRKWIFDMEYNYFKIPRPNVSIFLDVPFEFTADRLKSQRSGNEREYLKGKQDIHEADFDLQRRVREMYMEQVETDENFLKIDCALSNSEMKSPESIHGEIVNIIEKRNLIGS
ncbi:MAG: dTMP kinase [Prevotellaceae bacterium]|jgi:dTMP kinase|nr:dTMP kinase [Prevotellaceae bacterium]